MFKSKKKSIDEMSIIEIIENVKHCKPMNGSSIKVFVEKGDTNIWLNPDNQTCFESGSYNVDDFRDWAKGTGKIVKGITQEHKDKFMEYDRMVGDLDSSLFMYFKYFWMLYDNAPLQAYSSLMYYSDADFIDKNKDVNDIVKDILSSFVPEFAAELEYMKIENVKDEHRKMGWGIKKVLTLLNYTNIGACNTPTVLTNIGWSWDLVFAKAYYMYLIKNNVPLPDIQFVQVEFNNIQRKK
jgi:hypothetical protein